MDEYEARAEMAQRQARAARSEQERRAFLEIANLWRRLGGEKRRERTGRCPDCP